MNHTPAEYAQLYDFSLEVLLSHTMPPPAQLCARIILNHSFKRGRPVAVIPRLMYFARRIGLDKSNTRGWLNWLDLRSIARCHTGRGVYLYKPDYRQWDYAEYAQVAPLRLMFDPAFELQDEFASLFDPTLDDALAAGSRDAILHSLGAGGPSAHSGAGPALEAPCGGHGADLPVAGPATPNRPTVAGPATLGDGNRGRPGHTWPKPQQTPVAGPATPNFPTGASPATLGAGHNARASGEPGTGKPGTVEPAFGDSVKPVTVAGPATPGNAADEYEILRRIEKVCGRLELARNRGRWIVAVRQHRCHLLPALEFTELTAATGFRTSAGACLNKKFNDLVANRLPPHLRNQTPTHGGTTP